MITRAELTQLGYDVKDGKAIRVRKPVREYRGDANPNWRGGIVALKCERCGADFTAKQGRRDSARFCTLKCFNAHQRETHPGTGRRKEYVTKECPECGTAFEVMPSKVDALVMCSRRCRARQLLRISAKASSKSPLFKGGTRADLGIYVRSAWEANYARYLNWRQARGEIAEWAYEPDTFEFTGIKRGTMTYTPDFRITETDGRRYYVEVKGHMNGRSATQMKRMAKYHPEVEVRLVRRAEIKALRDALSTIIPHWEQTR